MKLHLSFPRKDMEENRLILARISAIHKEEKESQDDQMDRQRLLKT